MSMVELTFLMLSGVAVFSALLAVSTTQVVHAALWLVLTLGAIAGCYLLIGAEFIAWVQVLIYIGAVVVLLLFALMLTRAPTGPDSATTTSNRNVAAAVSVLVAGGLAAIMVSGFAGERLAPPRGGVGSAASIGDAIFGTWVLPFEILSLVLLAALVGAIVLTRRGHERDNGAHGDVPERAQH